MTEPQGQSVTSGLTRKLGPLPVWAYGAIIVAAALGYRVWKARTSGSGDTQAVPLNTAYAPADDAATSNNGSDAGAGDTGGLSSALPTTQGTTSSPDNDSWSRNVATELVAEGKDPTAVTNALSKYVNGTALNAQEQAIVSEALTKFGQPPQGVIPVKVAAPVAAAPTQYVRGTYTVQRADVAKGWSGLALRFLGSASKGTALQAANGNHSLSYFVGKSIVLPRVAVAQ